MTVATPRTPQLVFVYGSLKKGFGNAPILSPPNEAMYCGEFTTKNADYCMYSYGGFPAVVRASAPLGGHHITGEVYLVTPAMLRRLDRLEGCKDDGLGWYERKRVFLDDGSLVWMYVLPDGTGLPKVDVDKDSNTQTWEDPVIMKEIKDVISF